MKVNSAFSKNFKKISNLNPNSTFTLLLIIITSLLLREEKKFIFNLKSYNLSIFFFLPPLDSEKKLIKIEIYKLSLVFYITGKF